jgi:hypothetical protein
MFVKRVDAIEDRLWYTAGLVDQHQHEPGGDALEGGRVVVSGLATEPHELLADLPIVLERDPPRQARKAMRATDLAPEHGVDLVGARIWAHLMRQ